MRAARGSTHEQHASASSLKGMVTLKPPKPAAKPARSRCPRCPRPRRASRRCGWPATSSVRSDSRSLRTAAAAAVIRSTAEAACPSAATTKHGLSHHRQHAAHHGKVWRRARGDAASQAARCAHRLVLEALPYCGPAVHSRARRRGAAREAQPCARSVAPAGTRCRAHTAGWAGQGSALTENARDEAVSAHANGDGWHSRRLAQDVEYALRVLDVVGHARDLRPRTVAVSDAAECARTLGWLLARRPACFACDAGAHLGDVAAEPRHGGELLLKLGGGRCLLEVVVRRDQLARRRRAQLAVFAQKACHTTRHHAHESSHEQHRASLWTSSSSSSQQLRGWREGDSPARALSSTST
eukprot:scaffold654_cov273-Prasinococcus_capsulatus_cf.AAC.2